MCCLFFIRADLGYLSISALLSLNSPDNYRIVNNNKSEVPHREYLKEVVSSLKSVQLYFDNFHCEIIKYIFHG
jgi:hypothetical protein